MPELLEPTQKEQGDEIADMETVGRGIETGVDADGAAAQSLSQRIGVGRVMDQAAGGEVVKDVGWAHSGQLSPIGHPHSNPSAPSTGGSGAVGQQ